MFTNKRNKESDVLRFIELYRSHEVLWNMNLSSYRRNDLKMKAYDSIALETKMTVEEVKKKIKSLRTAYSAEKSKVDNSKKSGSDTDSTYIPTVFWYNELAFLDASLIRRKTVDNSNQGNIGGLPETLFDSEGSNLSFSQSYPSCSRKRKHSPEPNSKLDDALDKLISINKDVSALETFGESVGKQLMDFVEWEAYEIMAYIQAYISKRKIQNLKNNPAAQSHRMVPEMVMNQTNPPSRTSTPLSENSSSLPSTDALFLAISDAEIFEEDC